MSQIISVITQIATCIESSNDVDKYLLAQELEAYATKFPQSYKCRSNKVMKRLFDMLEEVTGANMP